LATNDLLTLDEAKEYLSGLTGSSRDGLVARRISAVSTRLDALCGPVVKRSVTETFNGGPWVLPTSTPVASITSVAVAGVAATAYTYVKPRLYQGTSTALTGWSAGIGNVVVTYVAGRYATTADVEPHFKDAAGLFLQHLWRPAEGAGSETYGSPGITPTGVPSFGVPNVVRDLLFAELVMQ
jgi:hypothetical protein